MAAPLGRWSGAWLGAKVRLLRPTNCANAPGGVSYCLGSAEEEFSRPISRLVVWDLVGAKVRLPRPTNCANAPWWFSSLFWLCKEEFSTMNPRMVYAEFFCKQCRWFGPGLGRKYAYFVLPTVLMPRMRFFGAETVYHQVIRNSSMTFVV